jgi:hypothetical protein
MTAFDDMVPKVAIWLTACCAVMLAHVLDDRQRLSWQKSMSKSGIDTRSGFRKRSNSRA